MNAPSAEQLRAIARFLRERADQHPDASAVAAWLERVATPGRCECGAALAHVPGGVLCPVCDVDRLQDLAGAP